MKERNNLDQYFTKDETIKMCMTFLKNNNIDILEFDEIIEPSAGSGNWLKYLDKYDAYDIEPLNENIKKADFLKIDYQKYLNKKVLVIGNPPFGKNASLAVKFFNYSSLFSNTICFIVPRTFRKESIKSRLNENFHLINEFIIPDFSYYEPCAINKSISISTTFQIWQKKQQKRIDEEEKNNQFKFEWCEFNKDPVFAIRRVGAYAGKVFKYNEQSIASHFYIKNKDYDLETYDQFYKLYFTNIFSCKFDVAGNPSITKKEFENYFNDFLKERKI
jgi:hypothetical protein